LLYVPGDRSDRIEKAIASSAEGVAVDLEDAVASAQKQAARDATAAALRKLPDRRPTIAVRINGIDSGLAEADLHALTSVLDRVDMIIVPMSSTPSTIRHASALLAQAEERTGVEIGRTGIIPLLETAEGISDARAIAAADVRVRTLAFGPADLCRELRITPTAGGEELLLARSRLVLAAAAAGLSQPIDGPYLDINDFAGLSQSAAVARRLGFGGKQVIHPGQLQAVAAAFAPTEDEVDWARRVIAAFTDAEAAGQSSIRLDDGTFVDYPIALRARDLMEAASNTP
jgi:citrate lyase subunit beta/citryl-CoA lyase